MKKYIIVFLLIFQYGFTTEKDSLSTINPFLKFHQVSEDFFDDCDACGCSASGGSMGFASMLNTNFVGIRYFNQSYKSTDGLYSNSAWYNESYNTMQVWARIPVVKQVQISALIPYHFHNRESANGKQNVSGIGDITILGMYQLYKTHKDSTFLVHSLQAGAGIKVPTGKFDEANNGSFNPSYQVGTGSLDYLLATEYVVKRKKFGLNTLLNYVIKTENNKNYRFGNQFNYSGTFFYLYEKEKYSIAPQLGFAGEVYKDNYQLGQKVRNTAGDIFFGKLGFEIGKDKFSVGANVMLPITQNLNGGNLEANYRWSLNLNYSL
ncbi:transporter [Flavobacterium sp. N2820]|uniref:transporter n=1 Tax=Flavobacterium sp. N2820 TaxID=2986834 RepID=UPI002224574B|nr:transporter [Flavobacterium sp. N2820]